MTMQARGTAALAVLERLGYMLALPLKDGCPKDGAMVVIHAPESAPENPGVKPEINECAGYIVHRNGSQVHLVMTSEYAEVEELARVRFPLMLLLMQGTVNDFACVMLHGAMLEDADGKAIVVIASSGVGKSTTARRFIAGGGTAPHDDQMLLCWSNAGAEPGFFIHGLPTWSRVFQNGLAGEIFPFAISREVKNIYVLTRGESREEIIEIPAAAWHGHLLAAFFEHMIWPEVILEIPEKLQLSAKVWEIVRRIDKQFRPLALSAMLDGDLIKTLQDAPKQNIAEVKNEIEPAGSVSRRIRQECAVIQT